VKRPKSVPAAAVAGFLPFIGVSGSFGGPAIDVGACADDRSCEGWSIGIWMVGTKRLWGASSATYDDSVGV
jgi:hypothetical protein